jgi:hypothetical protein
MTTSPETGLGAPSQYTEKPEVIVRLQLKGGREGNKSRHKLMADKDFMGNGVTVAQQTLERKTLK